MTIYVPAQRTPVIFILNTYIYNIFGTPLESRRELLGRGKGGTNKIKILNEF